jgi:hypothetical protein
MTYRKRTKLKEKLRNPENLALGGGSEMGIENIKFFNILEPMGETRNIVYKKL